MYRYATTLIMGYAMGVYLSYKPFYYAQYYLPEALNPMVEKYNGPYIWHDDKMGRRDEKAREARNALYYTCLRAKMNE